MDRIEYKNTEKALKKYGDMIIKEMTKILDDKKKSATGDLIKSFKSEVEEEDGLLFLDIEMASYAQYVDSGRKPGTRPNYKAIRQWVDDKPIRVKNKKISKDSLAFAIMESIRIKGIEPTPFLHLVGDMIGNLNEDLAEGMAEDMKDIINEYIEEFNKK